MLLNGFFFNSQRAPSLDEREWQLSVKTITENLFCKDWWSGVKCEERSDNDKVHHIWNNVINLLQGTSIWSVRRICCYPIWLATKPAGVEWPRLAGKDYNNTLLLVETLMKLSDCLSSENMRLFIDISNSKMNQFLYIYVQHIICTMYSLYMSLQYTIFSILQKKFCSDYFV